MRLAAPSIPLTLNGATFSLRPSLGAAIRLAYAFDDFGMLFRQLAEGSLATIATVIAETSGRPLSEVRAALAPPLAGKLIPAIEACMTVVAAMLDFGETRESEGAGPSVPLTEVFEQLYRLGSGWIGWPPESTWSATPQEIIAAHRGRCDLLKSIFGGAENDNSPSAPEFTADPHATAKLQALVIGGGNIGV